MMAKKFYLNGGTDIFEGGTEEIDRIAIREAEKKVVCVLDLTTNDVEVKAKYSDLLKDYFEGVGAEKVYFYSSSENIGRDIQDSGVLYFPGGHTELFIDNLRSEEGLVSLIEGFDGIVIGNSAGTAALSKKAVMYPSEYREKMTSLEGLGVVYLTVFVHYNDSYSEELLKLSEGEEIYAISEGATLIVDGDDKSFDGSVYLFKDGEKSKL